MGNRELAQGYFDQIIDAETLPKWAIQRKIRATKLRAMLDDGTFETRIAIDIRESRAMLNLPEMSYALPVD